MQTRRRLLKFILLSSLTAPLATMARCSQAPQAPVPFQTGEEVVPPIGCTELRKADQLGDC